MNEYGVGDGDRGLMCTNRRKIDLCGPKSVHDYMTIMTSFPLPSTEIPFFQTNLRVDEIFMYFQAIPEDV